MNLIVQGNYTKQDLENVATIFSCRNVIPLDEKVFVAIDVNPWDASLSMFRDLPLDYALVPDDAKLSDIGLAVFDMDSTLINIECVDEIAKRVGVGERVSELTSLAMQGKVDHVQSLLERVRFLEGTPLEIIDNIWNEQVQLNPGVSILFDALKRAGIKTMLATSGFTAFSEKLDSLLNFDFLVHNTLATEHGKLTGKFVGKIVTGKTKAEALIRTRDWLGLAENQVIAVGDGANDVAMMQAAGISIAYRGKTLVRERATYNLNFVGLDGILRLLPTTPYSQQFPANENNLRYGR